MAMHQIVSTNKHESAWPRLPSLFDFQFFYANLLKEHLFEPQDFLWQEDQDVNKSVWIIAIHDQVTEADPAPYEMVEFPGGMFLVATGDENNEEDREETVRSMFTWIQNSAVFEYGDFPKSGMSNVPNPDGAFDQAPGIAQQQIFLPLKFRAK